MLQVVKMIMEKALQPVIVFSFSRRDCEAYALQMSKLDFNKRKYNVSNHTRPTLIMWRDIFVLPRDIRAFIFIHFIET